MDDYNRHSDPRYAEFARPLDATRRFFAKGERSKKYRFRVCFETAVTLFFLGVVNSADRGSEGFGLPTTRAEWAQLMLRAAVLLWMFHMAHAHFEAELRMEGV